MQTSQRKERRKSNQRRRQLRSRKPTLRRKLIVIEHPELQTRAQRLGYTSITLVFWGLYLYLWQPLISLLLWTLGLRVMYRHMIELQGYTGLAYVLGRYALIIIALSVVLIGWARINYYRFYGVERRKTARSVELAESADFFGVQREELAKWRRYRSLVVHHDEMGRVLTATPWVEPGSKALLSSAA